MAALLLLLLLVLVANTKGKVDGNNFRKNTTEYDTLEYFTYSFQTGEEYVEFNHDASCRNPDKMILGLVSYDVACDRQKEMNQHQEQLRWL